MEMPYDELLGWLAYFEERPVGWRNDLATYNLLKAQGVKAKPHEIFPSLEPICKPKVSINYEDGEIDPSTFKNTLIYSKMLTAIKGDQIDI